MTPVHAIMVLIIRLWAAGIIISQTISLSYLPFMGKSVGDASSYYVVYDTAHTGVLLASGVFAWIFASMLSKLVYPKKDAETVSIAVSADTLVTIGSFLIGLFYLAEYVPSLIVESVGLFIEFAQRGAVEETGLGTSAIRHIDIRSFVSALLIAVVAFWMAFRPAHIAHIFSKLRRAGLAKVGDE